MEIKQAQTQGSQQAHKYPIKNAKSGQMPQYLVSNPYTHVKNNQQSLGLSKNVNFQKYQQVQKPIVKINTSQRFGLSQDTPLQNKYIEYNQHTQAIFNKDQAIKDEKLKLQQQTNSKSSQIQTQNFQKQRTILETQVKKAIINKVFNKLSNSSLSQDQQKKVMLLYNKDGQISMMKASEQYLDKLAQQKDQRDQSQHMQSNLDFYQHLLKEDKIQQIVIEIMKLNLL